MKYHTRAFSQHFTKNIFLTGTNNDIINTNDVIKHDFQLIYLKSSSLKKWIRQILIHN